MPSDPRVVNEAEGEDQGNGRHDRACDRASCDSTRSGACGRIGRGRLRARIHRHATEVASTVMQ